MQHQRSHQADTSDHDHQSLINAVAHIMRLSGLEADSVTERLRAAMSSIHLEDVNRDPEDAPTDRTRRDQLQPDRSIWGQMNSLPSSQHPTAAITEPHPGTFQGLPAIRHQKTTTDGSRASSGAYTTGSSDGYMPFGSSTLGTSWGTATAGLGILSPPRPERHATPRIPPGLPISVLESKDNMNTSSSFQQTFRPMQAVLNPSSRYALSRSLDAPISPPPPSSALSFSDKYFGMHTSGNASADHLPPDQNCALWLRNLPPDVTYRELLSSIRGIGRIWCTFINRPDFIAHSTAAAKVVFFAPESAALFLRHVAAANPSIRGFRIRADHNRIKYARHAVTPGGASRVLIVTGEAWFINEASLTAWFADRFIFQVDEVIELVRAGGRAVVEFRFGSYRCQAQMGKMSLDRIRPPGFEKVEFGDDPCEKGDSLVSYRISAERIQREGI